MTGVKDGTVVSRALLSGGAIFQNGDPGYTVRTGCQNTDLK
jgi:hypothetical protein